MSLEQAEILIIGGGIAGLSTAFHLAQMGQKGIVLLEREDLPGFYASGHNAGVGRQLTGRPEHTALAIAGRNHLAAAGLMDGRGGLLLGADPGGTDALAREAEAFGLAVKRGEGAVLPGLRASEFLHIPSDGVIDIDAVLQHCGEGARRGGAVLDFGRMVEGIHPQEDGFLVETDRGPIHADRLVNASGGWAQALGRKAGGLDIPFNPLRRHLVWSGAAHPDGHSWAWWADRPIYVRPESGGLLMCACEEQTCPLPARGKQPEIDPSILDGLLSSLEEVAPSFQDYPITRLWSGLRTFAPDRRFVIGPDPINPRLFWVAGLGGHGMTSGLAVGELAARALLGEADTGTLSPSRLMA